MHRLHTIAGLAGALALAAGLTGCGGSNDNNNNAGGGGQQGTSQIRTFNAIVPSNGNTGTLNITAGGTTLSGQNGLGFGQLNPAFGFMSVPSGTFTPSGSGTGFTNPVQLGAASGLAANANYTLVAAGQMDQTGASAPQFFLLPDFNSTTTSIPSGQAAVRFVNLSPGADTFGLFGTQNGGFATPLTNSLANVAFGFNAANNSYQFVPVQSGTTFSIRNSTTPTTDVALANGGLAGTTFQAGHAYTVFLYGQNGNVGQPLSATVVQDF